MHLRIVFPLLIGFLAGRLVAAQLSGPLDCTCSDVDPRVGKDKHLKFVEHRCFEHYLMGDCEKQFMFNTIQELTEGFCQITCGRCSCCRTLRSVASDEGLSELNWAMEISGLGDLFNSPGWEVAMLAPRDGALEPMLNSLGFTRQDVENDEKKRKALSDVLKFNIIPADPDLLAVYTEPFINDGMRLNTLYDGEKMLEFKKGSGSATFSGPLGSTMVEEWDRPSCKGYLNIVDTYLMPFEDADVIVEEITDPGVLPGYCETAAGGLYGGELIDTILTGSAEECCEKCKRNGVCTVWTFCAKPSGCQDRNSPVIPWGTCDLKFDAALTLGLDPTTIQRDAFTAYHSGVFRRQPSENIKTG